MSSSSLLGGDVLPASSIRPAFHAFLCSAEAYLGGTWDGGFRRLVWALPEGNVRATHDRSVSVESMGADETP